MGAINLEMEYTVQVRKLLYITEFMLLLNYVEVIVPIIFCESPDPTRQYIRASWSNHVALMSMLRSAAANSIVMYHLPNSIYYSQITSMDERHLWDTIENVLLYGRLQLASLVVLLLILWQKLRISALRQLVFVLEKQGEQVHQASLMGFLQRSGFAGALR